MMISLISGKPSDSDGVASGLQNLSFVPHDDFPNKKYTFAA